MRNECNFHYVAMPIMTQQILKSVNFMKTQKSRYLKNKTFFLQKKKKYLIAHQGLVDGKKRFAAKVTFSRRQQNQKVVEEKLLSPRQIIPPKYNLPSYESKNSHSPQSRWEICSTSIQKGGEGTERGR